MSKWYGSLNNRIDEGKTYGEIKIGTGVTEMCYSDRHPYEVVEIIDEKHLLIRECDWKIISGSEQDGSAEYEYKVVPYKDTILTKELLDDNYRMLMISAHNPKLYEKILSSKIGDVIGNNNRLLVKTKYGWKERYSNGKYNTNKFTVGFAERYYDPSF
jgi:hypothetical protein